MKVPESKIMVMMDALLDTRMGTLLSLGEQYMTAAIADNVYYAREEDKFPGIDINTFKTAYSKRDIDTLKNSGVTQVIALLEEYTSRIHNQNLVTPFHFIPSVILNTYPYKLSNAEIETFKKLLVRYTNEKAKVDVVYMSYEDLTPTYVKQNLTIMIMYDYYQWLEIHAENKNFETTICPEVTLLGPRIYFNGRMKLPDVMALQKENLTPFQGIEAIANPLVSLNLLPVEIFSFILQFNPPQSS